MPTESPNDRFKPHAAREMASMFDDVSGRYDLLNKVMSLGQDSAWREVMWGAVPEDARTVLDLCTGSGVSLPGLKRPGRTVLGMDVSFAMLEVARDTYATRGWAPRIVNADGFRLPLRDGALDAVTVAFGIRNLRPRSTSLAEIARVLRPGGTLVVLEATAPAPGLLRPFLAAYVRHIVPLLGRLSPDPSAYRYLSESIFEFGHGPTFEAALAGAGFTVVGRRSFLLGATRLWVARSDSHSAERTVQDARRNGSDGPRATPATSPVARAARRWLGVQAALAMVLTGTLGYALSVWLKLHADLPLTPFQQQAGWWLLIAGTAIFGVRALWLGMRWVTLRPPV